MSTFIEHATRRFVTAPLDVVKIRLQLQPHRTEFQLLKGAGKTSNGIKYTRILPTLKTILREEGIRVCMHNVSGAAGGVCDKIRRLTCLSFTGIVQGQSGS